MKLLVLSDTHGDRQTARRFLTRLRPDGVIHLGDYLEDGEVLRLENPEVPFWWVPGNCDVGFGPRTVPDIRVEEIGGVQVLMTHGHRHRVKSGTQLLLQDGKRQEAQLVLYGHTHIPDCFCDSDGMWVMNPGYCQSRGGSVGVVTIDHAQVTACEILYGTDLEEIL